MAIIPGIGNAIGRILTELPALLINQLWYVLQILSMATLGPLIILDRAIPAFIGNIGPVQYWLEVAECWFPVEATLSALQLYLGFVSGFITVKMILKLIPWIG